MEATMDNTLACGRYVVELLRAALLEEVPREKPEEFTFEEIYSLVKKHHLETMTYEGIRRLRNKPESELMERWRRSQTTNMARSLVQRQERDRILNALTEQGIDVLPLKGCQMIEMYPKPEYRQMADLDIMIRGEQAERVRSCLEDLGYDCLRFDVTNEDTYGKKPFMHLEMHRTLMSEASSELLLKEYFRDAWGRALPEREIPHRYYFSWDDYYIYMLAHFYKHYNSRGSGIRNVMDLWVFRQVHGSELNQDYVERELRKMKLTEFRSSMEELSDRWFGSSFSPLPSQEELEMVIITSGAYGLRSTGREKLLQRLRKEYGKDRGTIRYMQELIFPSYQKIIVKYPRFYGYQKFLPVLWILRWGDKILHDRERIYGNIKLLMQSRKDTK